LNGDIIDGWYLEKRRFSHFPEMHSRVLDALNKKAADGTRVIFLPGNHDERLRYSSRHEMEKKRLDKNKPNFVKEVIFSEGTLSASIEFMSDMVLTDKAGRKMRILHGDIFDPPWVSGGWSKIGDKFYDAIVIANNTFSNLAKKFRGGVRFSIAKLIKKNTKHAVGIIANFENAACDLPDHIDGLICGHIHHAEIARNNGKLYVNSGDWIESCTAAANDEAGNWKIIHWEDERLKLGLRSPKYFYLFNPNRKYRGITKKQLKMIYYFWPAKNRRKILERGFDFDTPSAKIRPKYKNLISAD
jgi:UDP-2,3-diacylglucosamine pyrophosphatase LpxH